MENMTTVANQVKDLAYENDLQAGVIAADADGQPLAVIIGDPSVLVEVADVLKADHEKTTVSAPVEETVVIPDPPVMVATPKKKGFFARMFG